MLPMNHLCVVTAPRGVGAPCPCSRDGKRNLAVADECPLCAPGPPDSCVWGPGPTVLVLRVGGSGCCQTKADPSGKPEPPTPTAPGAAAAGVRDQDEGFSLRDPRTTDFGVTGPKLRLLDDTTSKGVTVVPVTVGCVHLAFFIGT